MILGVWASLICFWIYIIVTYRDMSIIAWWGLLFLWILLLLHYIKSYRKWKREDKLRRESRTKELLERKSVVCNASEEG